MYISYALLAKWNMRPIFPKDMHFKESMAMRIKNRLKGKAENLDAAYCVRELSSMVSCLKRTDFDEGPCSKEIVTFQECVARESKSVAELRKQLQEGAVMPGAIKLSYKQLNNLFDQWPVPGARKKKTWVFPATLKYEDYPSKKD